MINSIKKLFRIKVKNTPDNIPPATPQTTVDHTPIGKGQKVDRIAFENTVAIINARLDSSDLLMRIVILALIICFITLLFGYIQFASTSFNDYSLKVKELQDDRYDLIQERLNFLENNISTQSAR